MVSIWFLEAAASDLGQPEKWQQQLDQLLNLWEMGEEKEKVIWATS